MTASDRLALAEPLNDADVSTAEIVATTRREEARTVMAAVASLRGSGVPVRDIAVVVRDLDTYEEPLYRAAIQYGVTPVFWTQLRVTQTRPYALVESVCGVLGSDELTPAEYCRPLEYRWCPQSSTSGAWPVGPGVIQESVEQLPNEQRTVGEWYDELEANPDIDERLVTYAEWLDECPDPAPEAVENVLTGVVETYEELGLAVSKGNDSPSLVETERDARAVVRVQTLVGQLRHKYADRLNEGTVDRSWSSVAELSQLIATQRPGRREHSNARAVDIFESNDVWLVDVPYVIAVGLVDGEWPQQTQSVIAPELQEAILRGDGRVGTLAPRTAWTTGRDRDQFDDTLRAARTGLIVTRHTESPTGEERRPSPLLRHLNTDLVPSDERRRLVSSERELPDVVRAMLNEEVDDGE